MSARGKEKGSVDAGVVESAGGHPEELVRTYLASCLTLTRPGVVLGVSWFLLLWGSSTGQNLGYQGMAGGAGQLALAVAFALFGGWTRVTLRLRRQVPGATFRSALLAGREDQDGSPLTLPLVVLLMVGSQLWLQARTLRGLVPMQAKASRELQRDRDALGEVR